MYGDEDYEYYDEEDYGEEDNDGSRVQKRASLLSKKSKSPELRQDKKAVSKPAALADPQDLIFNPS